MAKGSEPTSIGTVAVTRPRVFISSTISDLRDVRSALRYWLESAGYDVQLSEYNDFDRIPEEDTFGACFNNVIESDFYILLIGVGRGSWYKESERLTVTRQEFRTARKKAMQGSLRIIVFVRAEVKSALRQWNDDGRPSARSQLLVDPEFTDEFLKEVGSPLGPQEDSGSQWVYQFTDFRDIIDALRRTLHLDTDLARRLLRENLLNELLYNMTLIVHKTRDGTAFPVHWLTGWRRKNIVVRPDQLKGQIWLTSDQLGKGIGTIAEVSRLGMFLKRTALRDGIQSGLFLDIDPLTGDFRETEAHRVLVLLDKDIDYVLRNAGSDLQTQIDQKFMMLARKANTGQLRGGSSVEAAELVVVLSLHDAFENVFNGMTKLAQWLMDIVPTPSIQRNPISPIEGMSEEIEAERFSSSEIKALLRAQVQPFGPLLTPALKEMLLVRGDLVPWLRSILPADVSGPLTDEQIFAIAEEGLSHFTASASQTDS